MTTPKGPAPDPMSAAGRSSDRLSLPALQPKMKSDPEGYVTELHLIHNQFNSALELFQQQAALNFSSATGVGADPTVAKDLSARALFLAQVTEYYPKQLASFPSDLAAFLRSSARTLPSGLRCHVAQALNLLVKKKMIQIGDTLPLFMELQTLGDKVLRKLAFTNAISSITHMNKEHRNEAKNRSLQNILFALLEKEDEARAKRSLVVLCELHRKRVWADDRTTNAICMACFHPSSRIMIPAILFLLGYEKLEEDDDSDASSDEDEKTQSPQVVVSKEAIYKAHNKGTTSSKKKKKAKLQRVFRSLKRQQRLSSQNSFNSCYSPLNHLQDPQGFAEKLFSRLQKCNEKFQIRMMMLKVIARAIGLHRLILLNFYPFVQKYVQPHQEDITNLLASAVEACHDLVPPDAVEPLFRQIVNQFVHDKSRPEAIAVGLNVLREICLRIPLLMTEELLQDLALYKKSHEKAVSCASRSLIALFREICPKMLARKDRGRQVDPKAKPKAFGEVNVHSHVPGVELLQMDDEADGDDNDEDKHASSLSSDGDNISEEKYYSSDHEGDQPQSDYVGEREDIEEGAAEYDDDSVDDGGSDTGDAAAADDDDDDDDDDDEEEEEEEEEEEDGVMVKLGKDEADGVGGSDEHGEGDCDTELDRSKSRKRKNSEFERQLISGDASMRALKRLAQEKAQQTSLEAEDGILSNEDFQRIKQLKAQEEAKLALAKQGFKHRSSEDLSMKRVDPALLEAHVKHKATKEEKLALVRAGREDREKFQSRTAVKQKKTGGLSNRQKERKKLMPSAARKDKASRSREAKRKGKNRGGKQFRGKKAWK